MSLTTRVATRADLPRLHPVIERAYRGESARQGWTHEADLIRGPRIEPASLQALVDDPAQRLLIALMDGAPIGCVQLADKGEGLSYLGLLCIDPALQRGGYGKQLLAAAEAIAREAFGATAIEMTVIDARRKLIEYYERRGYRVSGEKRDFPIALDPPLFMDVLVKQIA